MKENTNILNDFNKDKQMAETSAPEIQKTPEITKTNPDNIPEWAQQLISQNKELVEKIKMFESMAGKNAVASYYDALKDHSQKFASFKVFNGKPVIGWSNVDMSNFNYNAKKAEDENMLIDLKYIDNTEEKGVNLILFERIKEYIKFKVLYCTQEISELELPDDIVSKFNLTYNKLNIATKFLNR